MILIVGTADDVPSMHVKRHLEKRGQQVVLFDTTLFPWEIRFSFDKHTPATGIYQENPRSTKIPLSDIRSVYRRWSKGINAPSDPDPILNEILYWNVESAIGSFSRCLDCLWVNSAEATDMHKYKGYQLKLLEEVGIRTPETVITNDPQTVREFHAKMGGKAICKPVRGWANTEMLDEDKLTDEALEALSRVPVKVQEFIPGRDIRVYLMEDEIFAMEIHSSTLDFREDTTAKRVPVTLPDSVVADCKKLAQTLGLVFTGIDMRQTPDGEYVFFEGNPTPVFLYDEQASGYPITEALCNLLIRGKNH